MATCYVVTQLCHCDGDCACDFGRTFGTLVFVGERNFRLFVAHEKWALTCEKRGGKGSRALDPKNTKERQDISAWALNPKTAPKDLIERMIALRDWHTVTVVRGCQNATVHCIDPISVGIGRGQEENPYVPEVGTTWEGTQ